MGKGVLFATFTLKFIVVCICTLEDSSSKSMEFMFVCSKRINTTYRTFAVNSDIGCCAECMKDHGCAAVSVNAATGQCWLHDVYTDECTHGNATSDSSWSVYVKRCDDGWSVFRGSCYKHVVADYTWTQAKQACLNLSASMVKIDDGAENDFIKRTMVVDWTWIGLNDRNIEDTFVWESDGSTPTFSEWYMGEPIQPNDNGGREDCVCLSREVGWLGWFDKDCQDEFPSVVCEKQAIV